MFYSSVKHNDDVKNEPADEASSDSDDGESDMDTTDVTGIKQEVEITSNVTTIKRESETMISDVTGIIQESGITSTTGDKDKSTAREIFAKTRNTTSTKTAMRYVHLNKTTFNWMSSKS